MVLLSLCIFFDLNFYSIILGNVTGLVNRRNDGCESLLEDIKSFCTENDITNPSMEER
jgi:hypothetical protein